MDTLKILKKRAWAVVIALLAALLFSQVAGVVQSSLSAVQTSRLILLDAGHAAAIRAPPGWIR